MSIIGLSGKIGSGKDLAFSIIQYLTTTPNSNKFNLDDYINDSSAYLYAGVQYENRKFADKLKDMVCSMINCTRQDLENRYFKDLPLNKMWWYYDDGCHTEPYIGANMKMLDSYNTKLIKTTPRILMQNFGTDACRNNVHINIWVNSLMSEYNSDSKWVITDVRFLNEVEVIKDLGFTIRINRKSKVGKQNEHFSETALDDYKFKYVIDNNGTIPELVEKIKEILIKEGIIVA